MIANFLKPHIFIGMLLQFKSPLLWALFTFIVLSQYGFSHVDSNGRLIYWRLRPCSLIFRHSMCASWHGLGISLQATPLLLFLSTDLEAARCAMPPGGQARVRNKRGSDIFWRGEGARQASVHERVKRGKLAGCTRVVLQEGGQHADVVLQHCLEVSATRVMGRWDVCMRSELGWGVQKYLTEADAATFILHVVLKWYP